MDRIKIKVTGRGGSRRKQLLDKLKETGGGGYCKLKEEAIDRTLWRTRFGRNYGPIARHKSKWMSLCTRTVIRDHLLGLQSLRLYFKSLSGVFGNLHIYGLFLFDRNCVMARGFKNT
jgi:hypothetical protein